MGMVILPFVVLGYGLRLLTHGRRFYRLELKLSLFGFVMAGLALRALSSADWPPADVARALFVAALSFIFVPLFYNATTTAGPGLWLLAGGALLQLAVVVANGGRMPVWQADPGHALYVAAGQGRLWPLGDVIPAPGGYRLSPGDLLAWVGLTVSIALAPPRRTVHEAAGNRQN